MIVHSYADSAYECCEGFAGYSAQNLSIDRFFHFMSIPRNTSGTYLFFWQFLSTSVISAVTGFFFFQLKFISSYSVFILLHFVTEITVIEKEFNMQSPLHLVSLLYHLVASYTSSFTSMSNWGQLLGEQVTSLVACLCVALEAGASIVSKANCLSIG